MLLILGLVLALQTPEECVEVQVGSLPLVLSVPHDGTLKPDGVADRTTGVKVRDTRAKMVAHALADEIEVRTGQRPFLVTSNLHRIKMDPNREIMEAAQGDSFAEEVWRVYHQALESACEQALAIAKKSTDAGWGQGVAGEALLLDIHGHGHPNAWIEVGHAVTAEQLANGDDFLDGMEGLDAEWVRGPTSIGAYLEKAGFSAVPSPRIPHPDGEKYFNGGYITRHYRQGESMRTIQLELPGVVRRKENLSSVAPRMADAVVGFLETNFVIPRISVDPAPLKDGPESMRVFFPALSQFTNVFGVTVVATATVSPAKVRHAASVLAEYMDNDEDGVVDDPAIAKWLRDQGAFLVMPRSERDVKRLLYLFDAVEDAGFAVGQDLYGEETLPKNPPHRAGRGRFDATLEEVWHLVSNGWAAVYPDEFGYHAGSKLCEAMDKARGGSFGRVPRKYPEEAWYHYRDRSCDYECMAAEYFYWALTSRLGGQDYPGRAEEVAEEWECTTPTELKRRDPLICELLENPLFSMPKALPDGRYRE